MAIIRSFFSVTDPGSLNSRYNAKVRAYRFAIRQLKEKLEVADGN